MLLYLILIVGAVGVILLLLKLASGPSASKALKRRMELVKERHAEGVTAAAQAQIRKLMAARSSRSKASLRRSSRALLSSGSGWR